MPRLQPEPNIDDILSEPIFKDDDLNFTEENEREADEVSLAPSKPPSQPTSPNAKRRSSKSASRKSDTSSSPKRTSKTKQSIESEEEDEAPLSSRASPYLGAPSPAPSMLLIPGNNDACPDCQSLGYTHPNNRYSCRTARCSTCVTCKLCRGSGFLPKVAKPSFSLFSLAKAGSASATGSSINMAAFMAHQVPLPKRGVISSVGAAREMSASKSAKSKELEVEQREGMVGAVSADIDQGMGTSASCMSENRPYSDFLGFQQGQNLFGDADGVDVVSGSSMLLPGVGTSAPISRIASGLPEAIAEEEEDDHTPLSNLPKSPAPLSKRTSETKYALGSDLELHDGEEGKYSYAQPGTLLHILPSVLEADKNKRPLDNRYGTGPLISLDVQRKAQEDHLKICNSLAYKQMIKAQEEQAALNAQKEREGMTRAPCDKCSGKGFSHPIDGLKIHDKGPNVECKFCRTCSNCYGTGLYIGKTSCLDCQSLGYIHPNEPYSCRNTGGPCPTCIPCKTCQGTGLHQKTGATPRLSLVSLTASMASISRKNSFGRSGSTVNFKGSGSGKVVISSPSDFRKLASKQMAITPSESRMFHQNSAVNPGDALEPSVSGILRDVAHALEEGVVKIPSSILAVPSPNSGRSLRNSVQGNKMFLDDNENIARTVTASASSVNEEDSDDEERCVDSDGALAKALQGNVKLEGSQDTLPEDLKLVLEAPIIG